MTDVVLGNRGRRGLPAKVRTLLQVRRNGSPASVRHLAVSPIPLCLLEFRFALVWMLVCISTLGLTFEGRAQDHAGDRQALLALYNATDGENWANSENWLSEEPLEDWHGVTVSDGRVTRLSLRFNRLMGTIPPELGDLSSLTALDLDFNQLTGPIPLGLGRLSNLTELSLSSNELTGPIPAELGNLSNLKSLDLDFNQMTGPIPPELGNLSNLTELSLSSNELTGPIPAELGNLSNLKSLDLDFNQMTGPIPPELGNLSNLTELSLSRNELTGPIPTELGNLSSLRDLDLSSNDLTGSVPAELSDLSSLRDLDLSSNDLTGSIPDELGDLSSLRDLNLSSNDLTGSIPDELSDLSRLSSLNLSSNQLTGPIPGWLGHLSRLWQLKLASNQLRGSIPAELGDLSSLRDLDLSNNDLTGSIPAELSDLSRLSSLILASNQLRGSIPAELADLSSLSSLDLSNNDLTGSIPDELSDLSRLSSLNLASNQLRGSIPAELGDLSSLSSLDLSNNDLRGSIPDELSDLSRLSSLNLSSNQLTGPIPGWLGHLSRLWQLKLSSNQLRGSIPAELGDLSSLSSLDLSSNQLTGSIPAWLGNLSISGFFVAALELDLSNNQLTGSIPSELGDLSSSAFGSAALELDLSNNQLTGSIPPELGGLSSEAFGGAFLELNLSSNRLTGSIPPELGSLSSSAFATAFLELDLSNNRLTGTIPPELGNLSSSGLVVSSLELDLSGNRLTGSIPPELGNLSSLRALNLSRNQLTGTIPQSFTNLTLEHFYFHGNPGLSVPDDAALREWLAGITELRGPDYSPATPFVPVILSSAGQNNSFFTSELTLTNRGTVPAHLVYTYTAHRGGGSGVAYDSLDPGQQRIVSNAIDYLRTRGVPIPGTGNRIGTLRVSFRGFSTSRVGVTVRTTTTVPEGRAGLAYPAVAAQAGFDEPVYLCGLRQNLQDRSNVAVQNMGAAEEGAITLRTTVYSGEAADARPRVRKVVELKPGEFHQYSAVLGNVANGYVKVERVEGTAPFYAYGVINDQANSDGSFVFPVTAGSLEGTVGQTLPVIVETGPFTSELMVTNFSDVAKTVTFLFRADAVQTPDKTATLEWTFHPGQQVIVPDMVAMMRRMGTAGIGPAGQTFAGALFATVARGDMSGIVIGARTGSPGGGGRYGVFYNAVPYGGGFPESAWVEALQQDEENRSNLALVNTGEVDGSPSVFHLDIYDGDTGELANAVTGLRVGARGWRQINGILGGYAPGTTQGYVRIHKISGNNPFLAYGVINDGGAPGQRSGDGAYLLPRD